MPRAAKTTTTVLPNALKRLAESLSGGALWIKAPDRILFWNDSMARLTGLALDLDKATAGEVFGALVPDEAQRREFLETIQKQLNGGRETRCQEVSLQTRTGAVRRVAFEIVALDGEDGGGALVLAHDETRRANAQNDLEILLRNSSDGIFVIDRNGQITLFNDALERITGYKREEVLYQSGACRKIFQCQRGTPTDVFPVLCPGRTVFVEHRTVPPTEQVICGKDGLPIWVECSYSPINDPNGEPLYFIGVVRDISARKQLEAQLRLSQKLATLGELVSGLAHEIRNPLGIIRSAADIVSNEERPAPQRREAAEFIKDEADRLNRTMKALLNFARPVRNPDGEPVDINHLLQRIVDFYAPQREGFEIVTRFSSDLPKVCACRDALQSVFLNLMLNADQALTGGGTLWIETEAVNGAARIIFRDNGPGIPAEILDKIFQPFITSKKSGTGLGLSLAAHVVEAHKGRIVAENQPATAGGGARFTIEIAGCSTQDE
jgi:nitrogen-specific signal transduction histidine kinase